MSIAFPRFYSSVAKRMSSAKNDMHLTISFSHEDKEIALRISDLCSELRIHNTLDERRDWLYHGLRQLPEDATHLLLILSESTEDTWWLPFLLGRAEAAGLDVLLYAEQWSANLPGYLRGKTRLDSQKALESWLLSVKTTTSI